MPAAHGAQRLPVDALIIAVAIKRQAQFIQTQVESYQYQRDNRQPEQDSLPDRRAFLLLCLRDRLVRSSCCCHTLFSSFPCNFTPRRPTPPAGQPQEQAITHVSQPQELALLYTNASAALRAAPRV